MERGQSGGAKRRRLAAILAADVVGYARLMAEDETGALAAVRAARAEVIEPMLAAHGGRLFKAMGDGFLAEFPSTVEALRCALAMQEGMRARSRPPGERIPWIALRVGVHQGDVVVDEDGDLLGDGINITVRLQALAEPGGICISARVHEDAIGRLALDVDDLGERALKNIPHLVHVFRVRPATETGAPGSGTGTAPRPRVGRGLQASPERRHLTILRCGLSGPALVAARRDPEDLQRLLIAFHARCAAIIHDAGGAVVKRLGEAVLAYFGYPQAHEDDAERAIRAALRLIDATGAIEAGRPGALQARVGIATGLVLVGDLLGAGSAEPAILGEAPNLAAGLLASAEPGTVLIAAATRRLVGETFYCREHPPLVVNGFADPISAWQVTGEGVEGRFEALRGRDVSELVGREEELALLLRRWDQAKTGAGRVVLLMGEPGIGKSRLIRAAQDRLASETSLQLRYFCSPHHRDSALHPVIAQLEHVAGFGRGDTSGMKLVKLAALLAASRATDEMVALVAGLLSIPAGEAYRLPETSPQRLREKTLGALLALFRGLAAKGPALVAFEDVHWIDPTTLELLARAVENVASMRVLLLMTARPEFKPSWPDQAHVSTVLLNRLSDDETARLADHVARGVKLRGTARRQILRHAEGVPLFVEELTKTVLESGLLAAGERSASLPVPTSLYDLLLARLDRLGSARELAQIGAVIGREFTHQLLIAVANRPETLWQQSLTRLVRSELLFRSGTPPDARYSFKHALVQQVAYESLPRSRRAALHVRVIEALLDLDPSIETTQPDLLAWHWEQGGHIEEAASFYTRAAFGSARRGAYAEAHEQVANASRMVAAMPEGASRDRRELEAVLCFIRMTRMHRGYASSEAAEAHRRAAEFWERLGRPAEFLEVPRARYLFHYFRGEIQHAQELASHLLDASREQADPQYKIMGHLLVGNTMMVRGEPRKAEFHLKDALTLIQSGADDPSVPWRSLSDLDTLNCWTAWAMAHLALGRVRCWLGHLDQGRTHISAVVERAPPMGYATAQVEFSVIQVRVNSYFTDAAELAPSMERLSKLTRELGLASFDAIATFDRGYVISCRGDPEQGIALMNEGMEAYSAIGAVLWSGYHRALLAEAYQRLGRLREGRQLLTEAQDWAERSGERWYDAELARRLGELDRQAGDIGAAESRFKQALATSRRQHAKLWELHAATSLARLWREQHRDAEARAVLAPVYNWFQEGFQTSSLRRAKALLDELDQSQKTTQQVIG